MTKRIPHFKEDQYSGWFPAPTINPVHTGWYECVGFRFDGYLHLHWNGAEWEYFGPKHSDPAFPNFGQHKSDKWRGIREGVRIRRSPSIMVDITGRRFGILTAIKREYVTPRGGTHWRCLCDCGNTRVLKLGWLVGGNTGSCGCRQHKKHSVEIKRPWDKAK